MTAGMPVKVRFFAKVLKSRERAEEKRQGDYNSAAARGWDDDCQLIADGEQHPEIATIYKRHNPYREGS